MAGSGEQSHKQTKRIGRVHTVPSTLANLPFFSIGSGFCIRGKLRMRGVRMARTDPLSELTSSAPVGLGDMVARTRSSPKYRRQISSCFLPDINPYDNTTDQFQLFYCDTHVTRPRPTDVKGAARIPRTYIR